MSTTAEVAPVKKEPEPTVHHDSQEEYESAEEIEGDYDEEDVEEIEIEEEVEEEEEIEEEDGEGEEEDEEGGDGSQKEKPLDDDEDRKNPQFIPKKGYFYEHDDRTRTEEENGEEPSEEPANKELEKPKKPADGLGKWTHDKFDESEQAPKGPDELSTTYGYDIRSEDQPPRARRRRRYGRGPTKYTRRWEEEEAYQKPRGGYRGRGRGYGGGRGSTRDRGHDSKEEVYEEEFPDLGLGGASSKSNQSVNAKNDTKPVEKTNSAPPAQSAMKRRDSREHPPARQETSKFNTGNSERNQDYGRRDGRFNNREQDRDNDNYYGRGGRGGRGGGSDRGNNDRGGYDRGGMNRRGGGRRNEFTNRNRYPNRRDNRDEGEFNDYSNNTNSAPRGGGGGGRPFTNSYENSRDRDFPALKPNQKMENNNRRGDQKEYRSVVNGTANEPRAKPAPADVKQDKPHQSQQLYQQPQQHRIPPFTNTEYPGPGKGNINSNSRTGPPAGQHPNRSQNERQNNLYSSEPLVSREPTVEHSGEPQKEVRDLREKLNAMRMQKGGYQNQNDRRSQIPPRLQQQQQQQQQQPPQQQIDPSSSKPRRYSTQRERNVPPQPIVTSGPMIPNSVAPPVISQGVPNMVPVVTMSEGVVPSTVAAFQPPNFYEGSQVYEASGSPVTGNGPSVSPSLWNPHANAYATAPYPSPPTAPQVPQPPYADPTAFIAPGHPGAPIYAPPPQFLQDPALMNYSGPAPPFPPPYHAHPQGFQGYAQVTPAPPPEVYHGGVTYYSTQNQIQRAPMMPPQKRPKSVLQLVEPPEKSKTEKGGKEFQNPEHPPTELAGMNPIPENSSEAELIKKMEETTLEPRAPERKPSPLREFKEETSWAEEMELTSPTSLYPEGDHFGIQKDDSNRASTTETVSKQDESNQDSSKNQNTTAGNRKEDTPTENNEKSDSVGSTN